MWAECGGLRQRSTCSPTAGPPVTATWRALSRRVYDSCRGMQDRGHCDTTRYTAHTQCIALLKCGLIDTALRTRDLKPQQQQTLPLWRGHRCRYAALPGHGAIVFGASMIGDT